MCLASYQNTSMAVAVILKSRKSDISSRINFHDCLPSYQMLEKISRFIFGVALVFGFALIRK